ncbi:MAG: hypothetical protein V1660_01665 [archaeon]
MINVEEKKNKIIEAIKTRGPSLPIHLSKEIELSSLFTSAIMSEMISNKMIKTSNLKVGSSPLYLIAGQEPLLENFSNHLGSKEKEVFLFIKEKGVVQDELLSPAYRIAIRSLKDFAIPLKVNINNEEKIFWRYLTVPLGDAVKKIRDMTQPKTEHTIQKEEEKKVEQFSPINHEEKREKAKEENLTEEKEQKKTEKLVKEKQEKKQIVNRDFLSALNIYLSKLKIEKVREIETRKKDIMMVAKMNSAIGMIEVLVVAKDKKAIGENDLSLALGRGQEIKMPVLFISSGKLNKKAAMQIETFKSYLIFKQIE